jgi:hypothetical protein
LRECVDEQLRNSGQKVSPALGQKVRLKRDDSPKCVSRVPPYRVSGKETHSNTRESVRNENTDRQSENMDGQRRLVPSH